MGASFIRSFEACLPGLCLPGAASHPAPSAPGKAAANRFARNQNTSGAKTWACIAVGERVAQYKNAPSTLKATSKEAYEQHMAHIEQLKTQARGKGPGGLPLETLTSVQVVCGPSRTVVTVNEEYVLAKMKQGVTASGGGEGEGGEGDSDSGESVEGTAPQDLFWAGHLGITPSDGNLVLWSGQPKRVPEDLKNEAERKAYQRHLRKVESYRSRDGVDPPTAPRMMYTSRQKVGKRRLEIKTPNQQVVDGGRHQIGGASMWSPPGAESCGPEWGSAVVHSRAGGSSGVHLQPAGRRILSVFK